MPGPDAPPDTGPDQQPELPFEEPEPEPGGSDRVQIVINISSDPQREMARLTAGDTAGHLLYQLKDDLGRIIPLGGGETITMSLRKKGASSAVINKQECSIAWAAQGFVQFDWSEETPVPDAGAYEMTFDIDGLTYPIGRRIPVEIMESLD